MAPKINFIFLLFASFIVQELIEVYCINEIAGIQRV
jgi:hypothetical protein